MSDTSNNNVKHYNYSDLEQPIKHVRFVKLKDEMIDVYGQFYQGTIQGFNDLIFIQERFCTFPIHDELVMYELIEKMKKYTDWIDLEKEYLGIIFDEDNISFSFTFKEAFLLIKETIQILNKMEALKDEIEERNRNQSQTMKEEADKQAEETEEQTVLV